MMEPSMPTANDNSNAVTVIKELDWTDVLRQAETCGDLKQFHFKGKARQSSVRSVSFDWYFLPAPETPATVSPRFDWLDMSWNVRFQKSPFDEGIPHPSAWSIFLDLHPPYKNVHHVTGTVTLRFDQKTFRFWQINHQFCPMWEEQELVTWCRKRLDIEAFVQHERSKNRDIVLRVKLSTVGLGSPKEALLSQAMYNPREQHTFEVMVGTVKFNTCFGWDIRKHVANLSAAQMRFWKDLKATPKGGDALKFAPRDIVAALSSKSTMIITFVSWAACRQWKDYVVQAVHKAPNGIAVLPHQYVYFGYDLMDGSDRGDADYVQNFVGSSKHEALCMILDWIVEYPLMASFEKHHNGKAVIFTSISVQERRLRREAQRVEDVVCAVCTKVGPRIDMPVCSKCRRTIYCSRECQKADWKVHKQECGRILHEFLNEKEQRRAEAAARDETMAIENCLF